MDVATWVTRVDERLQSIVADQSESLAHLGPDVAAFIATVQSLTRGGKRFRAVFCALGYSCASPELPESLVSVAAGLELFHAAALAHDDIMDKSDTRRGLPSAHRTFESSHHRQGWAGDAEHFGVSSALLLGDFLLAMSDAVISAGINDSPDRAAASHARHEFDRMRFDVTAGQYLDIVEESAWPQVPQADALNRAAQVLTYKSAKYSIEAPLVIGASLAGASPEIISGIRKFAVPLGNAFQLRDDVLGVFGDTAVTGKPVGDDIREGKRTVLIALALAELNEDDNARLNSVLGNNEAADEEIAWAQETLKKSGALNRIEERIQSEFDCALRELAQLPITEIARADLQALADRVVKRDA